MQKRRTRPGDHAVSCPLPWDPDAIRRKEAESWPFVLGFTAEADPDGRRVRVASAAEKTGLNKGDLILAVDGLPADTWEAFRNALRTRKAGDVVRLKVSRGETESDVTLELGKR